MIWAPFTRRRGGAIGFDQSSWSWVTASLPGKRVFTELASNTAHLSECKVVFAGNNNTCGNSIRFPAASWETLFAWVRGGGRLYIAAEHSGNYDTHLGGNQNGMTFPCLGDMNTLNSFLSQLGSSINYIGYDYNSTGTDPTSTPGAASIAQGITYPSSRFGEIDGGTTLWIGPAGTGGTGSGAGHITAAIEQIEQGVVVVIGDSNISYPGALDFLQRLYDWDVASMI